MISHETIYVYICHTRTHARTHKHTHARKLCYIDIRVFNPLAPSNSGSSIQSCYRKHEVIKKRAYEYRIHVMEHSTFILLEVATGGMGHEATIFYKRLASLLSNKWKEPYSSVLGWVRCHLLFCLLQSTMQCIRGARSFQGHYIKCALVDQKLNS